MLKHVVVLGLLGVFVVGSASLAQQAQPAGSPAASPKGAAGVDWPQYRGPTRDGIAPVGPKLADNWPKDGPPLLWKSEPLWPDSDN